MSRNNRKLKKDVKRDVDNDMRKHGPNAAARNMVSSGLKGRNMPSATTKKLERSVSSVTKGWSANLRQNIKVQNCLTPQALAVLKLMDDPFNANWDLAKMPYYPGGQPLKSTVVRSYGITEFQMQAGLGTQIYWTPNPCFAVNNGGLEPQPLSIASSASNTKGILGCPPCAQANSSGNGAGLGPAMGLIRTDVSTATLFDFNPVPQATDRYVAVNTASDLGEDSLNTPGKFAYRVVAAGIRLIPLDKELNLGGLVSTSRIAESNNIGLSGTTIMNANSSAHYFRGDHIIEMKYARSSADDGWFYPSAAAVPASTTMDGCRHFITVAAPDDSSTPKWAVVAIAFYEVKGVAAKQVGTPSFQQPDQAGKIQTAMSHVAQKETGSTEGSSKKEFTDAVELVNAKEHPQIGKIAADAKTHKSFLEKVEDFAGEVLPVAKRVAELALGL